MQRVLLLILLWCGINTLGEVLIKFGSRTLSDPGAVAGYPQLILEVLRNPLVMLGVIVSAVDLLLWIYILKFGDLSVVAPLTSINYVFAVVAGCVLFGEVFTMNRMIGLLLICGGTYFISR